jgi:2-polyprenyl-6-methoxyphenol hydroxylase-like FAD-dependent oxidoreductase
MLSSYDLIIVGGGIGGSALAITMARAGYHTLVLEKTPVYQDMVRGEWISPWGVRETKRLDLYDLLIAAGGHHVQQHITYDETRSPESSEATGHSLGIFFKDVPGPLSIGHPHHCQTLFDEAARAGAATLRNVTVTDISNGASPSVAYSIDGSDQRASARLIVGADGRVSQTRTAAGIDRLLDPPHHWFAGLLVEDAQGWDERTQIIGTENKMGFLVFPQGKGRVRLYGGYSLNEGKRFSGPDGVQRFLEAMDVKCSPNNRHLVAGKPAGPLFAYYNRDGWSDQPYRDRIVLIGDAAGWNDPILGLGLSITYRDVRIVSDLLKQTDDWSADAMQPYGEERRERMRRLRFIAKITSRIDMEFDDEARERRRRFLERMTVDASVRQHLVAIMAGPETASEAMFTDEYLSQVYGEETA